MAALVNNFAIFVTVVRFYTTSLRELLALRTMNRACRDAVDNDLLDVFAKILTREDLEKAFDHDNVYPVRQAYYAHQWLKKTKDFVYDPKTETYKPIANIETFVVRPPVASFRFVDYFVRNDFRAIDNFFVTYKDASFPEFLIDSTDSFGKTALWHAIRKNNLDRVRFLVSKGAHRSGYCYVYNAAVNGDLKMVKLLVEEGFDVNYFNDAGMTAIFVPRYEIMEYLLSLPNVDVNHAEAHGHTALTCFMMGCDKESNNKVDEIKLLLSKGATITARRGNRMGAVDHAIFVAIDAIENYGYHGYIDVLLNHKDIEMNVLSYRGYTPLLHYLETVSGKRPTNVDVTKYVERMIELGSDLEYSNREGVNVFHASCRNLPLLRCIMKHIKRKHPDKLVMMLNAPKNRNHETPLLFLASERFDHHLRVDKRIPPALSIEATDKDIYIENMAILIENGADISARNESGRSINNILTQEDYNAVISFVKQRKERTKPPSPSAQP